MTMFLAPYTAIADLDGSPLDAGFLFFGEYGKDPESFPIETFWDAEFTIPTAQPIRTRNGYPVRNGSPAKVHLKQPNHSIAIKNRNGAFILVDFTNKGWDITFTEQQKQINDLQEKTNLSIINYVNPKMWGAKGDGIADDAQAIRDCFNFMVANNATLNDFSESKYRYNSNILVSAPNKKLNVQGNCEFVSDNNYITFSGANEQIGYIASAVTKGSRTISLNANVSLSSNDLIAIHNSRISSLSTHRDYYYDGEYKIVESVSANVVTLRSQLETAYPSGTADKVWKINPITINIIGVKFIGNGFTALRLSLGRDCTGSFTTENLNNSFTSQNSFIVEKCFSCKFESGRYLKLGLSGSGTDYGVTVSNSQDILFTGGYAYGGRHGTAIGGGSGDMTVPSRRVRYEKMTIENDPASSLHAADMHGNAIDCHYKNNNILGRISLSGKNPASISNKITPHKGDIRVPIGLSEIVEGRVLSLNDEVISTGSASFVMGWLASSTIAKVTGKVTINIQDIEFAGNENLLGIYPIFNMPTKNNVVIDGFNLVGDAPLFDRLTNYSAGTSSVQPSYIQITRPKFAVPENVSIIASGATLTNTIKNVFSSSGTNANGTWIKNPDGSMICTHKITGTVALNIPYVGGFKSPDFLWSFPKAFIGNNPEVSVTSHDGACFSGKGTGTTLIQSNVFGVALTSFASAGVILNVMAIGRHLP
ncbi:MAG: hypothetical protein ACK4NN_12475 [Rheinheimera sp.]